MIQEKLCDKEEHDEDIEFCSYCTQIAEAKTLGELKDEIKR